MATIQMRTRIDKELKKQGDVILKNLGLDAGTYISMSLAQLVNRRGLPFAVTESDEAYFAKEYGLTPTEKRSAGARMKRETARARASGQLKTITGLNDLAP